MNLHRLHGHGYVVFTWLDHVWCAICMHIIILAHMDTILYLFIGYRENRVCHKRLVHATARNRTKVHVLCAYVVLRVSHNSSYIIFIMYCTTTSTAMSHLVYCSILNLIKTHNSESWGQEATCMHIFRPTWPLQWVIYMDDHSTIIKCCNLAAIAAISELLQTQHILTE